jgi:hypothetical protein
MDNTDTDIDYDKIMENLNNSDYDKNNSIKQIIENVENDIKNNNNNKIDIDINNNVNDNNNNNNNDNDTCYINLINSEYRDIIILILLFILINNDYIIEIINNKICSYLFPNLIIRSLVFGIILYILKKCKLL